MAVRLVTDASRYPLDYLPPQIVDHLQVIDVVRASGCVCVCVFIIMSIMFEKNKYFFSPQWWK